ncbi:hypothetical protein FF38_06357 [Lucilia cuprina]|uniref:Uncharacterized protein n=1 Tax=Lucilia cuprina TaxID=7375 RepID=A0A0L0C357_LUCCU|nr:hypothetical protein FF38_06357 [Lucilia cuprina]
MDFMFSQMLINSDRIVLTTIGFMLRNEQSHTQPKISKPEAAVSIESVFPEKTSGHRRTVTTTKICCFSVHSALITNIQLSSSFILESNTHRIRPTNKGGFKNMPTISFKIYIMQTKIIFVVYFNGAKQF